jgi:hypothetical protein
MESLDCKLVVNALQCVQVATWDELTAIVMVGMLAIICAGVLLGAIEILGYRAFLCFIAAAVCIWLFLSTK